MSTNAQYRLDVILRQIERMDAVKDAFIHCYISGKRSHTLGGESGRAGEAILQLLTDRKEWEPVEIRYRSGDEDALILGTLIWPNLGIAVSLDVVEMGDYDVDPFLTQLDVVRSQLDQILI